MYLFVESQHGAHHVPGVGLLQDVPQQVTLGLLDLLDNKTANIKLVLLAHVLQSWPSSESRVAKIHWANQ